MQRVLKSCYRDSRGFLYPFNLHSLVKSLSQFFYIKIFIPTWFTVFLAVSCWSKALRICAEGLKVVSTTFLLVCFSGLKESTCETWKNVFYFTSKTLFVLEKMFFSCFMLRQMMTSWHLNTSKVKIWLSQERKELSKELWKKHFSLFLKCSPLDIQNKLAKMSRTQPLRIRADLYFRKDIQPIKSA